MQKIWILKKDMKQTHIKSRKKLCDLFTKILINFKKAI